MIDQNEKGEYQTWHIVLDANNKWQPQPLAWEAIAMIDGRKVLARMQPIVNNLKAAAAKDNILLTLNSGFRTFSEQFGLRKLYVIDKSKVNDEQYLLSQDSDKFSPACARPGCSNHQDGLAFDFLVRDNPNTPQDESLAYKWLVKNAIKYGFIRAVRSERWHWEYRPGKDMFSIVPKTDPTWDGLV